jgi:hypothetical protein
MAERRGKHLLSLMSFTAQPHNVQLSRRDTATRYSSQSRISPPNLLAPPPPPQPPPLTSILARTIATSSTENVLAAARASLKHAPNPSGARNNPSAPGAGARTRRTGVATVNVPSDKMAAFLKEMKNVRLRKVSGGVSSQNERMSMPSQDPGNRSGSRLGRYARSNPSASHSSRTNEENVEAGKKRKWQAFAGFDSSENSGKLLAHL